MKFRHLVPIFALLCSASALAASKYDGNQLLRLHGSVEDTKAIHKELMKQNLDIWDQGVSSIDVRVPPFIAPTIRRILQQYKDVKSDVKIADIGSLISSFENKFALRNINSNRAAITLDEYHNLTDIYSYLDQLENDESMVETESIARTFEGRAVRVVRVSTDMLGSKPIIWLDCGIHAREWVSPATCIWGLENLVNNYGLDSEVTLLLDTYDFYILPVVNPDGYEYSWEEDRLWRKNRNANSGDCSGVDLNRNYDDGNWGTVGSSSLECSDTFHGTAGFSEAETSAIRDKVTELHNSASVFASFNIHSYSQLWLYVYGWTGDASPSAADLNRVSAAGVAALESVHQTVYTNGPHYDTIYPAAGTAIDWSYSIGIDHSYILELRDTGTYGFLLPEDQILATAEEAWAGIFAAIQEI